MNGNDTSICAPILVALTLLTAMALIALGCADPNSCVDGSIPAKQAFFDYCDEFNDKKSGCVDEWDYPWEPWDCAEDWQDDLADNNEGETCAPLCLDSEVVDTCLDSIRSASCGESVGDIHDQADCDDLIDPLLLNFSCDE